MSRENSQPNNPNDFDFYQKVVFKEHQYQARKTFNLFLVATVTSLGISAIGGALLISGKATEGAVTSATGLLSTTFCSQVAKESSKKLDDLLRDLKA